MKNLKIFIGTVVILLGMSCSSYDKKAVQIAEDYAQQHICPLFDNAELSDMLKMSSYRWEKFHYMIHMFDNNDVHLDRESALLNSKYTYLDEIRNENDLIKEALRLSARKAIRMDSGNNALCIVHVSVRMGDINDYEIFDIVVSKEYKVMNQPVDMQNIKQELEEEAIEHKRKMEEIIYSFGY